MANRSPALAALFVFFLAASLGTSAEPSDPPQSGPLTKTLNQLLSDPPTRVDIRQSVTQEPVSPVPATEVPATELPAAEEVRPQPPTTAAPTTADPTTESKPRVDHQALAEILRLRKRMGSLTKGTVLEHKDGGEQFSKSLTDVIRSGPQRRLTTPSHQPRHQPRPSAARPVEAPRVYLPTPAPLVTSLRQTARLLDQRAADFEDHNEFERADRIRELAQSLRTEARGLTPRRARSKPAGNTWR